ncbi:MAG TPA: ATP-binding cassette domain-containing protein [Coriobacteriia bacterium]|nr:ATP-binding cassette domain-containing protein [Coriobacteriia bacterium]
MTDHVHNHAPVPGEIVRISCVKHRFEDGTQVDLCGLDFVATKGRRVAVLGPNGSGKTTMLYHILGLLRAEEGLVRVFGVDPSRKWKEIRRRIGVVLQNVDEQILAPTVADDVAFSPRQYGLAEAEVHSRVEAALQALGIAHLSQRVPHNLSGGEKRKVAMAGAIVMEPELLVLDEPFEGLDPFARRQMIDLLDVLAAGGVTIIMTTHDIDSVPEFADYCYVLRPGGEIALKGSPADVFASADAIAASNIKPPVLAELFARLKERDVSTPAAALTIGEAVDALVGWKQER